MATHNPSVPAYNGRVSPAIRYLDTTAAYDLWSEVYDTDGNFLQALDTIEMKTLLPQLIAQIQSSQQWKFVDLGCGTGRNTSALLKIPNAVVIGLDASPKMLDVAKKRLEAELSGQNDSVRLHLEIYDLVKSQTPPPGAEEADAIVSTLVLEHVPIGDFFGVASKMVKENGLLLVTNMHSEMGGISQAGFIDPRTGEKVRPKSYSHRIDEVLTEARRKGFHLVGDVLERSVDEPTSRKLGERARKWIGVTVWFGIIFRKTSNE